MGADPIFEGGHVTPANAVYIAGEVDPVITMDREAFDAMDETVPNLRKKALLPGAGHRIQQERPAQVNQWLREFLATL